MIYEMRVYHCIPGRLPALLKRFDTVTLKPLEITEAADVSSVAVEATVVDAAGRFVTDLEQSNFVLREDGHP